MSFVLHQSFLKCCGSIRFVFFREEAVHNFYHKNSKIESLDKMKKKIYKYGAFLQNSIADCYCSFEKFHLTDDGPRLDDISISILN